MDPAQICLEQIKKDFKIYNREKWVLKSFSCLTWLRKDLRVCEIYTLNKYIQK